PYHLPTRRSSDLILVSFRNILLNPFFSSCIKLSQYLDNFLQQFLTVNCFHIKGSAKKHIPNSFCSPFVFLNQFFNLINIFLFGDRRRIPCHYSPPPSSSGSSCSSSSSHSAETASSSGNDGLAWGTIRASSSWIALMISSAIPSSTSSRRLIAFLTSRVGLSPVLIAMISASSFLFLGKPSFQ